MVSDIVPLSGENYIMNSASIHLHTFQFIVAYPGPELSTCSILQSMIVHALTKENRDSNIYFYLLSVNLKTLWINFICVRISLSCVVRDNAR